MCAGENASEPAVQPCTRQVAPESPIRKAIGRGVRAVRTTAAAKSSSETEREVLVAPHPPFEPADGFGRGEARSLLGLRGVRPRVHGLFWATSSTARTPPH